MIKYEDIVLTEINGAVEPVQEAIIYVFSSERKRLDVYIDNSLTTVDSLVSNKNGIIRFWLSDEYDFIFIIITKFDYNNSAALYRWRHGGDPVLLEIGPQVMRLLEEHE